MILLLMPPLQECDWWGSAVHWRRHCSQHSELLNAESRANHAMSAVAVGCLRDMAAGARHVPHPQRGGIQVRCQPCKLCPKPHF
jgi:hypothetical protein